MSESSGFRSGRLGILPLLAAALLLTACANSEYMGISLTEGVGDPALRSLAQRASAGDKQAQLDLGIRYEEGLGMPVSIARAKKLYSFASGDSGGILWVYSPPVGRGTSGRVIPVDNGLKIYGLDEARARLTRLEKVQK